MQNTDGWQGCGLKGYADNAPSTTLHVYINFQASAEWETKESGKECNLRDNSNYRNKYPHPHFLMALKDVRGCSTIDTMPNSSLRGDSPY